MSRQAKLNSEQVAEAVALRRRGFALERIAAQLGVSHSTISRALKKSGEQFPTARRGAHRRSKASKPTPKHTRPTSKASKPTPKRGPSTKKDDEALVARLRELDPVASLDEVRVEWLPKSKAMADEAFDRGDPVAARDWTRLHIEMAERLQAAIPPPAPDPAEDPRNLEARAAVRAHLARLAARRRSELAEKLCAPCRALVLPTSPTETLP